MPLHIAIQARQNKWELVRFTMGTAESYDEALIQREALAKAIRQPLTSANRLVQLIREMHPGDDVAVDAIIIFVG